MERRNAARNAQPPTPMELLEPIMGRLGEALSPDNLAAQANMSRGRFAVTQCTTIFALLLVLLIITVYGFIRVDEFQHLLFSVLMKPNVTKSNETL
jgi:hypothetical protein